MVTTVVAVLCTSCGKRLARDHADTICSPCRRTGIENSARRGALMVRDSSGIKDAFDSFGLYGVADHLGCTPEEALDVLVDSRLLPFVSARRHAVLHQLVALGDISHVAAAEALNISRWTVATYRHELRLERIPSSSKRSRS
jgi:hypothetical protein